MVKAYKARGIGAQNRRAFVNRLLDLDALQKEEKSLVKRLNKLTKEGTRLQSAQRQNYRKPDTKRRQTRVAKAIEKVHGEYEQVREQLREERDRLALSRLNERMEGLQGDSVVVTVLVSERSDNHRPPDRMTSSIQNMRQNAVGNYYMSVRLDKRTLTNLRGGTRLEFLKAVRNSILDRSAGDYDIDEDVYDYDIINIRTFDEMRDEEVKQGDLVAHHKFSIINYQIEKKFQMFPLRLHDFPCIYESLMIIKFMDEQNGHKPPVTTASWLEYVLYNFNSEPYPIIYAATSGLVKQTIEFFNKQHNMDIGFFNIHNYKEHAAVYMDQEAMDDVQIAQDVNFVTQKYFLAYWREHVFPIERSVIPMINDYMNKYMEKFAKPAKQFAVIPGITNFVCASLEQYLNSPEQNAMPYWLYEKFDLKQIIPLMRSRNILEIKDQEKYYDLKREVGNAVMGYLRKTKVINCRQQLNAEERRDKAVAMVMKERARSCWFPTDPQTTKPEELAEFIERRRRKCAKVGWAALDIETLVDPTLEESGCNFRPYLISIYGRMQRIARGKDKHNICWKVETVDVGYKSFWGLDCIEQFVMWLIAENFVSSDMNFKQDYMGSSDMKKNDKRKKLTNYIFAHNGFKFDFRFLYEKIYSMLGDMLMIGDMSQTKAFVGQGLEFYDTILFFAGTPLAALAEDFFPKDPTMRKLDSGGAIAVDIDKWNAGFSDETRKKFIEYCERDAMLVKEISEQFFTRVFTTPFGHGFASKIVYHSAPAMAWDIWRNCFLKVPLFINPECQSAEQRSYRGGLTVVLNLYMLVGLIFDITSSYPASMKNKMPAHYKYPHQEPRKLEKVWSQKKTPDYEKEMQPYNLYYASFEFPEDCYMPTIAVPTGETMVCPRSSGDRFFWLWGYELTQAMRLGNATITTYQAIEYECDSTHDEYIDYMFAERQKNPADTEPIMNLLFKLFMNALYGKHGQQLFDKTFVGGANYIIDMLTMFNMQEEQLKNLRVEQVMSYDIDIFQLKIHANEDDVMHKGTTVRIASYITALSRCNLMEGNYAMMKEFGPDNVMYNDTDSIHTSIEQVDVQTVKRVQQLLQMRKDFENEEVFVRAIHAAFKEGTFWERLQSIKIRDIKNVLNSNKMINMIDDNELGAYKIEKFIFDGVYIGPKTYLYSYIEDNITEEKLAKLPAKKRGKALTVRTAIKSKGVPDKARDLKSMQEIGQNMRYLGDYLQGEEDTPLEQLPVRLFVIKDMMYRVGAGVSITTQGKMIRPSLTKRAYNLRTGTSQPHDDISSFLDYKKKMTAALDKVKDRFKKEYYTNILEQLATCPIVQAHRRTVTMQRKLKDKGPFLRERIASLIESRKKFMVQLPKIKYMDINEQLYRAIQKPEAVAIFHTYMFKAYIRAAEIIKIMKARTKKGLYVKNGQDESKEDRIRKIDDIDTACIVSYMMFTKFLCKHFEIAINERLETLFARLGAIMRYFANDEKDNERYKIQQTLALSLHFLSVPIAIQASKGQGQQEIYTNLWRVYKYMMRAISTSFFDKDIFFTGSGTSQENIAKIIYEREKLLVSDNFGIEMADFTHLINEDDMRVIVNDEEQDLQFMKQPLNEMETVKLVRNQYLVPEPRDPGHSMDSIRDKLPTNDIDVGLFTLQRSNLIRQVEDVEMIDTSSTKRVFDQMGLLQERQLANMQLIQEDVSSWNHILPLELIPPLLEISNRIKPDLLRQYGDIVRVLLNIYAFCYHCGEEGREIFRKSIEIFKKALPKSPRQQLFKAVQLVFGDPAFCNNVNPTRNTHAKLRDMIEVFTSYFDEESSLDFREMQDRLLVKCSQALKNKYFEVCQDQKLREDILALKRQHGGNNELDGVIQQILFNEIDCNLILSEQQQNAIVFAKLQKIQNMVNNEEQVQEFQPPVQQERLFDFDFNNNIFYSQEEEENNWQMEDHEMQPPHPIQESVLHKYASVFEADNDKEFLDIDQYLVMYPQEDADMVVAQKEEEKVMTIDTCERARKKREIAKRFFEMEAEENDDDNEDDDNNQFDYDYF